MTTEAVQQNIKLVTTETSNLY